MKEYFAEWGINYLYINNGKNTTVYDKKSIVEFIPKGLCSLAFTTCYPYIWTLEHGGWFRWVARYKRLIKWRSGNLNLSHEKEVLAVCPNPDCQVLFGISANKKAARIRVLDVKGECANKHVPGQLFYIKQNDTDAQIFYQIYPYYCAEATRNYQSEPKNVNNLFSGPDGQKISLYNISNIKDNYCTVCHNSRAVIDGDFLLNIAKQQIPCRYQPTLCSFRSNQIKPMGEMCLDAAWAVYPSALAELYDASCGRGRFFNVSCPSGTNRVIWEIRSENLYNILYRTARIILFKLFSYLGICIDRPDKKVKLCVKEVIGKCPAGYKPGMEFSLNISDQSRLCPATFVHFYPLILLWLRGVNIFLFKQHDSLRFRCPDVHGANYRLS